MVDVRPEAIATLDRHGETSIEFEDRTVFDIKLVDGGLGGPLLSERTPDHHWGKAYDADAGGPCTWELRFVGCNWGLFGASETMDSIKHDKAEDRTHGGPY